MFLVSLCQESSLSAIWNCTHSNVALFLSALAYPTCPPWIFLFWFWDIVLSCHTGCVQSWDPPAFTPLVLAFHAQRTLSGCVPCLVCLPDGVETPWGRKLCSFLLTFVSPVLSLEPGRGFKMGWISEWITKRKWPNNMGLCSLKKFPEIMTVVILKMKSCQVWYAFL